MCINTEKKEKILLVEDNLVNCEVAIDMLEELGYQVEAVHDGDQAIKVFDPAIHALILMDCEMPVMNGFTATTRLRENENRLKITPTPIVALTAHAVTGARDKCFACGMDDFLSKPFSMKTLQLILHKWLSNKPGEVAGKIETGSDDASRGLLNKKSSEINIIDHAVLHRLNARKKEDGTSLADKVITIYLDQSSKLLDKLSEASKKQDVETVREISHALKSSSVNVGAIGLSDLCKQVEHICKQGRIENSLVEQVQRTYTDVEKALRYVLK